MKQQFKSPFTREPGEKKSAYQLQRYSTTLYATLRKHEPTRTRSVFGAAVDAKELPVVRDVKRRRRTFAGFGFPTGSRRGYALSSASVAATKLTLGTTFSTAGTHLAHLTG